METLLTILDEKTSLNKDTDLFALEMPLDKYGCWIEPMDYPSRYNGTDVQEYNLYYRSKSKTSANGNLQYLQSKIDEITTEECQLDDGTTFRLELVTRFSYLGKSEEGWFIFVARLRLML